MSVIDANSDCRKRPPRRGAWLRCTNSTRCRAQAAHQLGTEGRAAHRSRAAQRAAAVCAGLVCRSIRGQRNIVIAVAAGGAFRHLRGRHHGSGGCRFAAPCSNCRRRSRACVWATWTSSVSFADRNDEIGDLGRDFNDMVAQLKSSREEIQRLHQTQMSRAEHFATLGELAAGLAHEIRNPLAGIAGVLEIVSRDLPADQPGARGHQGRQAGSAADQSHPHRTAGYGASQAAAVSGERRIAAPQNTR